MYKVVVVDDKKVYRDEIASYLKPFPAYKIVGNCATVEEAAETITREKPDLVFLDVMLPPLTGFDLLTRIPIDFEIIFITAFLHYAIRAFEVAAVDFLEKGAATDERIEQALNRFEEKYKGKK